MRMYAIYPVANWKAITPHDTNNLEFNSKKVRCRAILVGGAGNIAVRNEDGTTTVLVGLVAGGLYPISTDRILATGTTATDIVAGFDSPQLT